MAVGEGGPANVLTAQANVVALVQEGAHGQGLRQAPVDLGIKRLRQFAKYTPNLQKLRQMTKYDKLVNGDKSPNLRQIAKFTTKHQYQENRQCTLEDSVSFLRRPSTWCLARCGWRLWRGRGTKLKGKKCEMYTLMEMMMCEKCCFHKWKTTGIKQNSKAERNGDI